MSSANERIAEIIREIKDEIVCIDNLDLRYDINVLICRIEDIINEKPIKTHHERRN